jgi:hypothetical protein
VNYIIQIHRVNNTVFATKRLQLEDDEAAVITAMKMFDDLFSCKWLGCVSTFKSDAHWKTMTRIDSRTTPEWNKIYRVLSVLTKV